MRLRCGSEVFDAGVRREKDVVRVTLAGRTLALELQPIGDGTWHVRGEHGAMTLHAVREGERIHLSWDGVQFTLLEEREGARARRPDSGALEAPMPGRVSVVQVQPGDTVAKGQELVVVEAMKMENALRAPHAGVVRAVHVTAGDMVAPGRALVEIDG
jgi:biotin carboxyl carrier protein